MIRMFQNNIVATVTTITTRGSVCYALEARERKNNKEKVWELKLPWVKEPKHAIALLNDLPSDFHPKTNFQFGFSYVGTDLIPPDLI